MSAYPSLLSPLMNNQGLIATSALNTEAQAALNLASINAEQIQTLQETSLQRLEGNYRGTIGAGILLRDETETTTFLVDGNSGDLGAKGTVSGFGFSNTSDTFQVDDSGNCTVNELTYTTLNPPIVPGATPSLSQVLAVSGNGGNQPITNVENLYVNNVINAAVRIETNQLSILNDGGTGYHVMESNASGVDLNTKFTSDGLILHKVAAGSDITIQNDANNLITLGTAAGYADLQVGILNYLELNPPIVPSATPTLSEVLEAGNDGGTYAIVGISNIIVNDSLLILKNADQPELGNYSLSSDATTGFIVNGSASLTANTLIGSSPDGIAFQNADASFRANFDGSIGTTSVSFPNSTSIIAGGNGEISFDGANVVDITELTVGTLNYTTLNPAVSAPTLGEVLTAGNTASADINMNASYKIYNALELRGTTIQGTTQVITPLLTNVGMNPTVKLGVDLDANNFGITGANSISSNSVSTGVLEVDRQRVKPVVKPTYTYFVAKGGSDSGTGTLSDPYLTIGRAIQVCEAVYDGNPRVINVLAGSYTENITLSTPRISIIGEGVGSLPDVGTSISGSITINLTSGNSDMNNNNIYIKGFLINGIVEDSTASVVHRVIIDNCFLYANDRVLYLHPGGDYRAFISNSRISNDDTVATNPLIECGGSGMVSFNTNQMTAKGASQNVFKLTGTCRIDAFALNILTSASTGANVAIAIFVHNSTATISIGQCAFIYSSSGAKRNVDTASGIYMNSASGGSLVLVQNFFSLTGLPSGQNAVQNSSTAGVVIFGSNTSSSSTAGTSAFAISGTLNVNKFSMTSCQ